MTPTFCVERSPALDTQALPTMARIRALFFVIATIGLIGLFVYIFSKEVWEIRQLVQHGAYATGTVVHFQYGERTNRKRRTLHAFTHLIDYNGRSKSFELEREFAVGTRIQVLYLPSDPDIARVTSMEKSTWALLKEEFGSAIYYAAAFVLLMILLLYWNLKVLFKPLDWTSPRDRDPNWPPQ